LGSFASRNKLNKVIDKPLEEPESITRCLTMPLGRGNFAAVGVDDDDKSESRPLGFR